MSDLKLTKRKAFNFMRSYFDVYNLLETDKEKIAFIDALLNKQFLGVDPNNLNGNVKLAWIGQMHNIEQQCKGWETKTGLTLRPTEAPTDTPRQGVTQAPPTEAPKQQEKEKGKEKEKEKYFVQFWDLYGKKVNQKKSRDKFLKLSDDQIKKIFEHVPKYIKAQPDKKYRKDPVTYLNNEAWEDEIIDSDGKNKKPFGKKSFDWDNYKI